MRTTVAIQDALLKRAKAASVERNCSLGEVIEDALRSALLAQPKSSEPAPVRPFVTFRGSGLQPGVDLSSSGALLDAMEGQ